MRAAIVNTADAANANNLMLIASCNMLTSYIDRAHETPKSFCIQRAERGAAEQERRRTHRFKVNLRKCFNCIEEK